MDTEILNKLTKRNAWWVTGKVPEERKKPMKREIFAKILERIGSKRIISLLGLRRTGKTTVIYQLIDHLLTNENVNPKHILFVSFDELISEEPKLFDEIFEWYVTKILDGTLPERVFIFLDELHFLPDWGRVLKHYFETYAGLKFVISDSASVKLLKEYRESLGGRIDELPMLPFSFRELVKLVLDKDYMRAQSLGFEACEKAYLKIGSDERLKLIGLFEKYLVAGGLPEAYIEKYSMELWQEYLLKDVVNKAIFEDLMSTYRIRNPRKLLKLLKYFSYNICGYYEPNGISRELGMSRDLVDYYTNYLLVTYLAFLSPAFGKEELRSREKMYAGDVGARNALLGTSEADGRTVENAVFLHLLGRFGGRLSYWRNAHEIDFVVSGSDKEAGIVIESKYSKTADGHTVGELTSFAKKFGYKNVFVVTQGLLKKEETPEGISVAFVPAWLFMLLV